MKKVYLPPEATTEYKMTFNADLGPGMYTIVMTVDLEDNNVFVKEVDFRKSYPSDFNVVEIRD